MSLRLRSRPFPLGFIEPCLPTVAAKPPPGPGWIHEIKHDGFRTLVLCTSGRVRALTRNGIDWTERFRTIAEAARSLDVAASPIPSSVADHGGEGGEGQLIVVVKQPY